MSNVAYPGVDQPPANPQAYQNAPAYPGTDPHVNSYPGAQGEVPPPQAYPGVNAYPGTYEAI